LINSRADLWVSQHLEFALPLLIVSAFQVLVIVAGMAHEFADSSGKLIKGDQQFALGNAIAVE
jgi:hypothetical protein